MIVYFDTSALLAILLLESDAGAAAELWDGADRIISSRLTYTEGRAALAAAHRAGRISSPSYRAMKQEFDDRFLQLHRVEPTERLCRTAGDLAERHQLRGYDAIHLASVITTAAGEAVIATGDRALRRAAVAEGIPPALR